MGSGIFLGRYRTQNVIIASSQIMSYWLTKKDNILKIVYSMKQESHIFSVNLITLKQQLVEIKNICQILSKTVQQAFLRPQ